MLCTDEVRRVDNENFSLADSKVLLGEETMAHCRKGDEVSPRVHYKELY